MSASTALVATSHAESSGITTDPTALADNTQLAVTSSTTTMLSAASATSSPSTNQSVTATLPPGVTVDASGNLEWDNATTSANVDATNEVTDTRTSQSSSSSFPLNTFSTLTQAMSGPTSLVTSAITSASSQATVLSISDVVLQYTTRTSSNSTSTTGSSTSSITKTSAAAVTFRVATTSPTSSTSSSTTRSSSATGTATKTSATGLIAVATSTGSVNITSSSLQTSPASDSLTDVELASSTNIVISSEATFISDGVTLTGQDAVAALAAEQTTSASASDVSAASSSSDTSSESAKQGVGSLAIVGIVGGVLVGLIILYIGWYQWRKKRARNALGQEIPDNDKDDEKHDLDYDPRLTRSSFGAEVPLTPAEYRRRRRRESYEDERGATWYDDRRAESRYLPEQGGTEALEGESREGDDGRTEYALTRYGDGMTAALADGMITGAEGSSLDTLATAHTIPAGSSQHPFVPPPPVPRVPSAYNGGSTRTVQDAPQRLLRHPQSTAMEGYYEETDPEVHLRDRGTAYGGSIYDAYTSADGSRRQTQSSEPSTSKLLSWLKQGHRTPAPPPAIPPVPRHIQQYDANDWVQLPPQARGVPVEQVRAPPRPAIAQTPMDAQRTLGWGGQPPFPTFR